MPVITGTYIIPTSILNANMFDAATFDPTTDVAEGTEVAAIDVFADGVVTITVANSSPVAVDDVSTGIINTNLIIDVLDNDTDSDGDTLSVTAASATNGTVTIGAAPDYLLTFTPNTDYLGTATITYTISDGTETDTAEVDITISSGATITVSGDNEFIITINAAVGETDPVTVTIDGTDYTYTKAEWESGPINLVSPLIFEDFSVTPVLTALTNVWTTSTGTLTYTYQWKSGGVNIAGATNESLDSSSLSGETITLDITVDDGVNTPVTVTTASVVVPAAGFAPDDISGLVQWYAARDTATITESSGSVSQLDDKSSSNNHITQATATNQPTTNSVTINGLNTITFDNDDYLLQDSHTFHESGTIFMVFRPTNVTSGDDSAYSYDQSPNGINDLQFDAAFSEWLGTVDTGRHTNLQSTSDASTGELLLHAYRFDFSTNTAEIFVDGGSAAATASDYTTAFALLQDFTLGSNRARAQSLEMDFCEFIRFNRALTDNELDQVGNFLELWGGNWLDVEGT